MGIVEMKIGIRIKAELEGNGERGGKNRDGYEEKGRRRGRRQVSAV